MNPIDEFTLKEHALKWKLATASIEALDKMEGYDPRWVEYALRWRDLRKKLNELETEAGKTWGTLIKTIREVEAEEEKLRNELIMLIK